MLKPLSSTNDLVIAGFVPFSTSDWPSKIVATVFLQGCPLRCVYCHNPSLIDTMGEPQMQWESVWNVLTKRKGLLDGVVFSGGEPTRQPALLHALRQVTSNEFLAGIHTCGAYPVVLQQALPYLSWVGLDIKAPEHKYELVTGRSFAWETARRSLELVQASGIDYEVRMTLDPTTLNTNDVHEVVSTLRKEGVRSIALQEARSRGTRESYQEAMGQKTLLPLLDQFGSSVVIRPATQ